MAEPIRQPYVLLRDEDLCKLHADRHALLMQLREVERRIERRGEEILRQRGEQRARG